MEISTDVRQFAKKSKIKSLKHLKWLIEVTNRLKISALGMDLGWQVQRHGEGSTNTFTGSRREVVGTVNLAMQS